MHFYIPSSWQRLICTDPSLSCQEHLFCLFHNLWAQFINKVHCWAHCPTSMKAHSEKKNEPALSECCLFKFLHRCMCRCIMASPNQILPTLTFSCLLLTSGGEIMANSGLDVLQFSRKVWDCMALIPFELTVYLFVKHYSEIRLFKIWKTAIVLLVNSAQVLHTKTGLYFLHFEQNFNMRWALTLINIPFFHLQCLHFFFMKYYLVLDFLYSNLI